MFKQNLNSFLKEQHKAIIIQTSDQTLLDYAANESGDAPDTGMATLGYFFEKFNKTYP